MRTLTFLFVALVFTATLARGQGVKEAGYPPLPEALMQAELVERTGLTVKLADYHGKVVLLNLWASWVGPSREEIPRLNELYNVHKAAGFEVIGLNVGDGSGRKESEKSMRIFAEQLKITYPIVTPIDLTGTTSKFYSLTRQYVVPQSILIGRDGTIRAVFVGVGASVLKAQQEAVEKEMMQKASGN